MKELKFGNVLNETFKTLRENFYVLMQVALVFVFLPQAIIAVSDLVMPVEAFDWTSGYDWTRVAFELVAVAASLYFSMTVVYILIKKKNVDLDTAVKGSASYLKHYILLVLLLIAFLVPLFIMLIIPGIIFSVYWMFSYFVMVDKKTTAWDAMKGSKAIVKGRWWTVFGYMLLLLLMMLGVMIIFIIIVSILATIGQGHGWEADLVVELLFSLVMLAANGVLLLFYYSFLARLYLALKKDKKEIKPIKG